MVVTPTVPNSTNVVLGEGKVYINYGEVTQAEIGATRGGSTFSVEKEIKEVEFDGAYGPVKGLRRKTRIVPVLKVNMLELNYTNIPQLFAGMTASDEGDYHKLIEDIDITDSDYLTNVAFVGERLDGKPICIIVKNALGDGNLEMAFESKEEVVPEAQFTGHYSSSAPTIIPYEIRTYDVDASDITLPTVTCVPTDAASGINVAADIVFTFSKAIKSSCITTANFIVMKADGTIIAGALSYNAAQTIITFNPTTNLTASTAHIAMVTTNVEDLAGNKLAAVNVFNFTTA